MQMEMEGAHFTREKTEGPDTPTRCDCGNPDTDRRAFLRILGGFGAAAALSRQIIADSREGSDFARLISPDKKRDSDWIRSLYLRGEPTVHRGKDLKTIGMLIGNCLLGSSHQYL
jgi:hypothetical protein